MTDYSEEINCGQHGTSHATFVCSHLAAGYMLGFYCSFEDDDTRPDAWCSKCNEVMLTKGGWNESSELFAQITLLCEKCYDKAKARNQIKMSNEEYDALAKKSYEYLNHQMKQYEFEYKISTYDRFDYDQESGEIIFSNKGIPKVIAEFQNVGSISIKSNTWLWAWANKSISDETKKAAFRVKSFGETIAIDKLTKSNWEADEIDGWEMTALTANLVEAKFAYRAPVDHLLIFMVITDVRWVTD